MYRGEQQINGNQSLTLSFYSFVELFSIILMSISTLFTYSIWTPCSCKCVIKFSRSVTASYWLKTSQYATVNFVNVADADGSTMKFM